MATKVGSGKTGGDGSGVPEGNIRLDGNIISAAASTFGPTDFSKGYSEPKGRMRMENLGPKKGSK